MLQIAVFSNVYFNIKVFNIRLQSNLKLHCIYTNKTLLDGMEATLYYFGY